MPGPDAMKPGDIVRAMNGKTIEVLNTDAEGRLILADALVYASRQNLDGIIDLATLTGAVVTALGSQVTGAMTNNKGLLNQILAAAAKTEEAFCELPLYADYRENIKSPIADLQNIGKVRGEAGSIIGGLFLQEFVDGKPWVHLDIAGTAWSDHPSAYCPAGGTGSVVRTLLEYLASL
jgi:leucyl aminopeptidase